MRKRQKANLALCISAGGFLATLPAAGFWGGLLHHGFLAATIGGLADWFAVTAIFRKPLGISYRTDILRRNRGRIMDALVDFASEDLLSTENIMQVVREQDAAGLFVDYLVHRGGRERLHQAVDDAVLKAVSVMNCHAIATEIAPALREGVQEIPLEKIFGDVLRLLADERHSRRLLAVLFEIGRRILESPVLKEVMVDNIRLLRQEYEGQSAGRAFVLGALGLTDERITQIICERLEKKIKELQTGETESYAACKATFEQLLLALSHDRSLEAAVREWKESWAEQIDLVPFLAEWMEKNIKGEHPFWLGALDRFLDQRIDDFTKSHAWQRRFDGLVKDFLEDELKKHHSLIPQFIRERLSELSDDELIAFVESKVEDDLQMIRINGALVGSLVGMGLFLVVAFAERMWG